MLPPLYQSSMFVVLGKMDAVDACNGYVFKVNPYVYTATCKDVTHENHNVIMLARSICVTDIEVLSCHDIFDQDMNYIF